MEFYRLKKVIQLYQRKKCGEKSCFLIKNDGKAIYTKMSFFFWKIH